MPPPRTVKRSRGFSGVRMFQYRAQPPQSRVVIARLAGHHHRAFRVVGQVGQQVELGVLQPVGVVDDNGSVFVVVAGMRLRTVWPDSRSECRTASRAVLSRADAADDQKPDRLGPQCGQHRTGEGSWPVAVEADYACYPSGASVVVGAAVTAACVLTAGATVVVTAGATVVVTAGATEVAGRSRGGGGRGRGRGGGAAWWSAAAWSSSWCGSWSGSWSWWSSWGGCRRRRWWWWSSAGPSSWWWARATTTPTSAGGGGGVTVVTVGCPLLPVP